MKSQSLIFHVVCIVNSFVLKTVMRLKLRPTSSTDIQAYTCTTKFWTSTILSTNEVQIAFYILKPRASILFLLYRRTCLIHHQLSYNVRPKWSVFKIKRAISLSIGFFCSLWWSLIIFYRYFDTCLYLIRQLALNLKPKLSGF